MVSFGVSDSTVEDQHLYLKARLVEVACLDCLAVVSVKKNSEHHTSIQWGPAGQRQCPEFNRMSRQPGGRQVHSPCPRLQESIAQAVAEGRIPIGAVDGY